MQFLGNRIRKKIRTTHDFDSQLYAVGFFSTNLTTMSNMYLSKNKKNVHKTSYSIYIHIFTITVGIYYIQGDIFGMGHKRVG